MRVTEALPKHVVAALNMLGAILLVLAAVPLLGALAILSRPLAVVLVLFGIPLFVINRVRFRAREGAPQEEEHHGVRVPVDRSVTAGHAWLDAAPRRGTLVGVDDLLARALGPVEEVLLPAPGTRFARGDVMFSLRHGSRQVDVRAPFAGRVVGANEDLRAQPELVSASPYGLGWVLRLEPEERAPALRRGPEASTWFRREVDRLLQTVAPAAMPAMPDGGQLSDDFHRLIDPPTWRVVHDQFFTRDA